MTSSSQEKIRSIIEKANAIYRSSEQDSGLTDGEYDYLLSLIDDESFCSRVGVKVLRDKAILPIKMGSLNKIKSFDEMMNWKKSHNISNQVELILSPKFDGLSLLVEIVNGCCQKIFTRGDGIIGQDVTQHFALTRLSYSQFPNDFNGYLMGEAIISKKIFEEKYTIKFKNQRNMVAGLLSRKEISEELKDINFLAFSVVSLTQKFNKSEELNFCNRYNNWLYSYKINYLKLNFSNINTSIIKQYFDQETQYKCDGVVITLEDNLLQRQLSYETGKLNPAWARAWKLENEEIAHSQVLNIQWQVSKQGYQKPVVQIKPVQLGGVTIRNVTGINACFIKEQKIDKNSIISIIRSGDVIPKIVNVLVSSVQGNQPLLCVSCQGELIWNETNIELQCLYEGCREKIISKNIDFFKILNIDGIGEGVVRQFYESGYDTIESILSLKEDDFLDMEGFKKKKAAKVYASIQSKIFDVPLEKIQHASNLFKGLGTKKLFLLRQYNNALKKPKKDEILAIDGFSQILANAYLEKFDFFWKWLAKTPISLQNYYLPKKDGPLNGKIFVFSGFRDKLLENEIQQLSGKIISAISSKTYALVVENKNMETNKIAKAKKLNINIFTKDELQNKLVVISSG